MKAKNIAKEAGKIAATGLGGLLVGSTFYVLGNLSNKVKQRIEKLSGGIFDSKLSRMVNIGGNSVVYPLVSEFVGRQYFGVEDLFTFGVLYWLGESGMRIVFSGKDGQAGSLPGKIVSLPLEGLIYVFDKVKGKNQKDYCLI